MELFDSSQRVPPFNNVARLFDPGIPAADYDAIREIFFREFLEPMIDKSFSRTATWNDFKGKTERPSLGTGTGLHSEAARELVLWFVERDRITIGSSKDDVVRIQGTPDEIGDTKWRYGASNLYFEKDKVTKWDISPLSPLKVILRPSGSAPSKRGFAAADTKDEVFRAQGPPTSFSESTWKYGDSAVLFDHGRVARFVNKTSSIETSTIDQLTPRCSRQTARGAFS